MALQIADLCALNTYIVCGEVLRVHLLDARPGRFLADRHRVRRAVAVRHFNVLLPAAGDGRIGLGPRRRGVREAAS
jgi:hypothetical protein